MSLFARIEEACAALIERTFASVFPSDLEPAQIARKLVATMEAQTRTGSRGLEAPGQYVVRCHPDDAARLEPHRAYLEREWAQLLREVAARVKVTLSALEPSVHLQAYDGLPVGSLEIVTLPVDSTVELEQTPVASRGRRFQLRMVSGAPAYGVYPIDAEIEIGRNEECDVFLVDPSVSRRHAVIDLDAGWPVVHDLGSTNGTFVNGERIDSRRLAVGDSVRFGQTELQVEMGT